MNREYTPFRYDYVGSFFRPEVLKQDRTDYEAGKITREQLTSSEDEAIRELVQKQKASVPQPPVWICFLRDWQ